jgi:Phosphopantetheine attachment site
MIPDAAGIPACGSWRAEDIPMRDHNQFMDCWRRVLNDAGSEQFDCATARQILAEALCLPQTAFCPDTQLASLEMDSLIVETIALHAEELTGREYDRADIYALATVRDLELLLSGAEPGRTSWSSP